MANDREFIIQPLISDGRLLKLSDINPNTSYVQVGVWQPNQQASGSPGNSYPSYALPISEISAKSNKSIIVVDETYGDDATALAAGIYDFNKPFQSIDAALFNAQVGDTLWVMPGFYKLTYPKLLDLNATIYAWSSAIQFDAAQVGTLDTVGLTIKGNATIYMTNGFDTGQCLNANIDIECNELYSFASLYSFYLDHLDYTAACYFKLKANYLSYSGTIFSIAALNYNINVDVVTLNRNATAGGVGDFWSTNLGAGSTTGYQTVCRYNFGNATINTLSNHSLIRMVAGAPENKYYVTGTYFAQNYAGVAAPTAIVIQDQAQSFVEIDATMNLFGVGVYATRNGVSQAIIKGNINHDNLGNGSQYSACYYIDSGKVKLYADTICSDKYTIYMFTGTAAPYLDMLNCKIINSATGGIAMYLSGARVTINNSKIIVDPASSYCITAAAALGIYIYSLYDNVATDALTISNPLSVTGVVGEKTNANFGIETNF